MLLFLGQAKCCVVLLRRSHCFRVKRDQEVRRVKYNVYRCFIVGRGAAAAADVASPVKSVPGEKGSVLRKLQSSTPSSYARDAIGNMVEKSHDPY